MSDSIDSGNTELALSLRLKCALRAHARWAGMHGPTELATGMATVAQMNVTQHHKVRSP